MEFYNGMIVIGVPVPKDFSIEYKAVTDDGRCYDEGEDEYFSRLAIEAGYELMVDPTIICEHYNYGSL